LTTTEALSDTGSTSTARGARLATPPPVVWLVAAIFLAVELVASAHYGFHRDELYFLVAGNHLAFGYVDQGPLAPLLEHLSSLALGTTPTAIRIVPALCGAATIPITALIVQTLGGGRFAQALAAIAAACDPVLLSAAHLANTTVYDLLGWALVLLFVLRALLAGEERSWLWAGLVAGVDLENKNLILLLAGALLVAIVFSPWRAVLRSRWLWAGVGAAALIFLPEVIWQSQHGWPSLAMSRALASEHSAAGDYVGYIPAQLIYPGLFAIPIFLAGAIRLARVRELRFLAIAYGLLVAFVFIDIPGRAYYPSGFYPVLFAAGAVAIEARAGARRRRLYVAAPVVGALASLVLVLPLLSLHAMSKLRFLHKLAYDQGETVGWPQLASTVADVYDALPPRERRSASIFTGNYGEAGAIAIYGPAHHLPPPLSGHNNYWLWGPGRASDSTVIAFGSVSQLSPHFARCRYDTTFHSPDNVNNDENGTQLWTCTGPHGPWSSFWGALKNYG
jgi:4-amino-4-deoxy-L-arabinose transferase-like glycosyltransferase